MPSFSRFELEGFAKRASDAFLGGNEPLNNTITSLAEDHGLNPEQVQRVVEGANTYTNTDLVKQARDNKRDPRVSWDRADQKVVLAKLNEKHPVVKQAAERRSREYDEMFQIKKASVNTDDMFDRMFGPKEDSPYGPQPVEVDPELLALDYAGEQEMRKSAGGIAIHSLVRACEVINETRTHARQKNAELKDKAEKLGADIRNEIHLQLMTGVSPATMRQVVKKAGIEPRLALTIDQVITARAKIAEVREGESAIGDNTLVDTSHPFFGKLAEASEAAADAGQAFTAESKLANAYRVARRDLNEALKASRGRQ